MKPSTNPGSERLTLMLSMVSYFCLAFGFLSPFYFVTDFDTDELSLYPGLIPHSWAQVFLSLRLLD